MSFIPYGFSPINPLHSIHDTPLWRDGSSKEPRFSGELLITLTALTPLIVGNHQQELDKKHSLLVPQMLDDGRVLIGAASLKGMLRSALVSLLQAPMERVAEHHYTYRPNLGFGPKNGANRREQRAAIIKEVKGEGSAATVTIDLLPPDCPVVFIRNQAQQKLGQPVEGNHIQCTISGVELTGTAPRMRLETAKNSSATTPLNHHFFLYHGGIDGKGHLAQAFKSNSHVYDAVLVPTPEYKKATTIPIPEKVLTAYYLTQEILADNQYGHLSPGYPNLENIKNVGNTQRSIRKHAHLQVNQLIYVEIEPGKTPPDKGDINITSMGHHFQYRWGYSSSVRYENRLLDGKGKLRAELALHPEEHADEQGAPQRLTSGRLLFGYAVDGRDEMQAGLAQDNFKRLAGRITFNTAIEDHKNKTLAERFMEGGKEIQLHILGMPRPSAVEFYLKQTTLPKKLTTYGDLPGDPGGNLAGRKFYRHQPDASSEQAQRYSPNERKNDANTKERGTCVRYLSRPGSCFRCTLRFDSLRPWELGVLLTALNPKLLESTLELPEHPQGYAHKLGYSKPLGLGSVRLTIDAARWQANDDWIWQQSQTNETAWQNLQTSSLAALKDKLLTAWQDTEASRSHLISWLKARAWADGGFAAYPTKADKDGNKTIFNYHTNLRRNHAAVRRGDTCKHFNELKNLLESGI